MEPLSEDFAVHPRFLLGEVMDREGIHVHVLETPGLSALVDECQWKTVSSRGIGAAKQRYTVFGLFEVACASGTGVQRRRWSHSPPQASFIRVEQLVSTVPFVSDYFLQLFTKWADCGRVRRQDFTTKLCVSNSMAIVEAL